MADILQVQVIESSNPGHKDLIVQVNGLLEKSEFDTYYICIAIEPFETLQDVKNAVANLLYHWSLIIQDAKVGETLYLPIDFSDQYTGCFKLVKSIDHLILSYGYAQVGGYQVSPINPDKFFRADNFFQDTEGKTLIISEFDFLKSILGQANNLKNVS